MGWEMSFMVPELERIGHFIELDPFRIKEVLKNGRCTFISRYFFNPGIYRVKNTKTEGFENFAISIDKVESASYYDLVERFGEDAVDESLWEGLSKRDHIYFYAFSLVGLKRKRAEARGWKVTGVREATKQELWL